MTKKYNLTLTPLSKGNEVVTLAKKLSHIADEYLLGEKSLPHVTLYQFQVEEKDIGPIWKKVCDVWKEEPIYLTFNEFSCITFDNNIFWVSLLPDNDNVLHKMHRFIADILLLPSIKTFDPHVTLINTKDKEYEKEVAKLSYCYEPIKDSFILSLGASDDIGQFTKVIHIVDEMMNCKI